MQEASAEDWATVQVLTLAIAGAESTMAGRKSAFERRGNHLAKAMEAALRRTGRTTELQNKFEKTEAKLQKPQSKINARATRLAKLDGVVSF